MTTGMGGGSTEDEEDAMTTDDGDGVTDDVDGCVDDIDPVDPSVPIVLLK
jgi:hypothetical protein